MSPLAHTSFCRLAPLFQTECARHRNGEAPFGNKLCVLTEYIIAIKDALLPPCGADADAIFVKTAKPSVTDNRVIRSMPRNGKEVRRRLQPAALQLYRDCGYEQTTAAEIAAKAGVTERTFFRHFPDKREVLFDGDAEFSDALTSAVRLAPPALSPWDTLFLAFRSVGQMFVENRPFSEPRQRVIARSPALQERAMAKTRSLIAALASTLCERGVPYHKANLAAQMGMAALSHAVAKWFDDDSSDLGDHILRAFHEVRDLSSSNLEQTQGKQANLKRSKKARSTSR